MFTSQNCGLGGDEATASNGGAAGNGVEDLDRILTPGQVDFDVLMMNMASGLLELISKWVEQGKAKNVSEDMKRVTDTEKLQQVSKFLLDAKERYERVVDSRKLMKEEKGILEGEVGQLRGLYEKTLESLKFIAGTNKRMEEYVKELQGKLGLSEEAKKALEEEGRDLKEERLGFLEKIKKLEEFLKGVEGNLRGSQEAKKGLEEEVGKLKGERVELLEKVKNLEESHTAVKNGLEVVQKENEDLKAAQEKERKERLEELLEEKGKVEGLVKQMELKDEKMKSLEDEKSHLEESLRKEEEAKKSLQKDQLGLEGSLKEAKIALEEMQEEKRKLVGDHLKEVARLEGELEFEKGDKARVISSLNEEKSKSAELSTDLGVVQVQKLTIEKKANELGLNLEEKRLKIHEMKGNIKTAKKMLEMEKAQKLSLERENSELKTLLEKEQKERAELEVLKNILNQSVGESVMNQNDPPIEENSSASFPLGTPSGSFAVKKEMKPGNAGSEAAEEVECITLSDNEAEVVWNVGNKSQPGESLIKHFRIEAGSLPKSLRGVAKGFFGCNCKAKFASEQELHQHLQETSGGGGSEGSSGAQIQQSVEKVYGCTSCKRRFIFEEDWLAHDEQRCKKLKGRKRQVEDEDAEEKDQQHMKLRSGTFK